MSKEVQTHEYHMSLLYGSNGFWEEGIVVFMEAYARATMM
jgi:hypothetical protein